MVGLCSFFCVCGIFAAAAVVVVVGVVVFLEDLWHCHGSAILTTLQKFLSILDWCERRDVSFLIGWSTGRNCCLRFHHIHSRPH